MLVDVTPFQFQERLSWSLKAGTIHAHTTAERAAFVRGFLRGVLDVPSYRGYLERLYPVYRELEVALLHHRRHRVVGALCRSELFRLDAIGADIRFLGGEPGVLTTPSAATDAYVLRIREVSDHAPELLVGHAYTRYLGDLSGGAVLARLMRKSLRLSPGKGDAYYRFPRIDDTNAYKRAYKSTLDVLPLSPATVDIVVDEARRAFGLNREIFDELGGSALRGLVQTMAPSLSRWIFRYGSEAT